jgi:HSP20 family molecular chaperone IbpA
MTSSIKWEPIEDMKAVRDLLAHSFLGKMPGLFKAGPSMDLYETDVAFVAEIDVPGLAIADIDLSLTGSQLTIEIERQMPEGRIVVFQERPVCSS